MPLNFQGELVSFPSPRWICKFANGEKRKKTKKKREEPARLGKCQAMGASKSRLRYHTVGPDGFLNPRYLCISEICLRRRFFFFFFFFSRETREISFSNIFEFFNERLFVLSFFDLLEEGT